LPGGKAVLFTVKSSSLESFDDAQIVVRSLETGAQHPVAQGGAAQYVPTGHLIYARAGSLYALRFDATRLTAIGAPIKVVDGVITHPNSGAAQFAIAETGTLIYAAGDPNAAERPLMWVDRSGAARPIVDRQASFWWPRISPDGKRIAVDIDAAFSKVWVVDIERGTLTRASQLAGNHERAEWSPDGSHITFGADPTGTGRYRLFADRVDGTGSASLVLDSGQSSSPLDWSADGQWLLYQQTDAASGHDLWAYSANDRKSRPFLQTAANESLAVFSPDSRWVAYVSDESGRPEIYVRPFPGPGTRTPISSDGGTAPLWSRDGRELFFARENTLFSVPVVPGSTFTTGATRRVFSGPYDFEVIYQNYDVAPDGRHFVIPGSRVDSSPRQLELVLNWFEELTRLAPEGSQPR
jgi:serine/threonine-protein kinase